ncbi:hypothetical protein [Oceanobacillus oncorhynchi]|uniref:hypothetical protein n=1 Tax=Oceanobacillus oncorhynchi TaxID=545501 RepID=UPI001868CA59|nr:hypothetical protein [Oceanobacillus oncorhynchi]
MKCNVTGCYWNLWSGKGIFNDDSSKQCVSEDLSEHFDENDDFEMIPNTKECPGYLSFREFCGVSKTD